MTRESESSSDDSKSESKPVRRSSRKRKKKKSDEKQDDENVSQEELINEEKEPSTSKKGDDCKSKSKPDLYMKFRRSFRGWKKKKSDEEQDDANVDQRGEEVDREKEPSTSKKDLYTKFRRSFRGWKKNKSDEEQDDANVDQRGEEVDREKEPSTTKKGFMERIGCKRKSTRKSHPPPEVSKPVEPKSSGVPSSDIDNSPTGKKRGKIKENRKVAEYFSRRLGSRRKKKESRQIHNTNPDEPSTSKGLIPRTSCEDSSSEDSSDEYIPPAHTTGLQKWKTQVLIPQETDESSTSSTLDSSEEYIPPDKIKKWRTKVDMTHSKRQKKWNKANPEDATDAKRQREWRKNNPDADITDAERQRNWREKNPEADTTHPKRQQNWRERNPVADTTNKERQRKHRERMDETSSSNNDSDNEELHTLRFYEPQFLGEQSNECFYCGAIHLPGIHICCSKGRVFVPPFPKLPEPIFSMLFDIRNHYHGKFTNNIVVYNGCFSFASMQYHRIESAPFGAQVAKSQGPIRHFPSAASPFNSKYPKFGNFYLYEDQKAIDERMKGYDSLEREIVSDVTKCLSLHNPFSNMYKSMGELMEQAKHTDRNPNHLRLRIIDSRNVDKEMLNQNHPGIYKATSHGKDFISVFYDSSVEQEIHYPGLTIYPKRGPNEIRPLFPWMKQVSPLCYPILFPHGEAGYSSRSFPVAADRTLSFQQRLQDYSVAHPNEAEMWDSDNENASIYVASESDRNLEESDSESDANLNEGYYDCQLIENAVPDESVVQVENTHFEERSGEIYPTRVPCEEIPSGSKQHTCIDLDADLDMDSASSQSEGEMEKMERELEGELEGEENEAGPSKSNKDNVREQVDETIRRLEKSMEEKHRGYVSLREYALYINQKRNRFRNRFSAAKKLGQLHTIDLMTRVRHNRSAMIRKYRSQYLTSTRKKFLEYYQKKCDKHGITIGSVTSMPASVPGSPRYLQKLYEDAVMMANLLGKPDLFLTFTTNVNWDEIKNNLPPGTTWADNPFLVNEVFMKKLDEFLDEVLGKKVGEFHKKRKGGKFGSVRWFTLSIEFQQRGPPHAHIIISLKNHIRSASEVDQVCQAELPIVPDPTHPDYEEILRLRELVERFMIHTPCENNPEAYCQKGKKSHWVECTKHYPKKHNETTQIDDRQYPQLKRRENEEYCMKHSGKMVVRADNRHVVPHNLELLGRYECHMNIEVISSLRVLKYIYKYLFKGFDRVLVEAITNTDSQVDPNQMTSDGHLFLPKTLKIPKGVLAERKKEVEDRLIANKVPLRDAAGKPMMVYDEVAIIEDMRASTANEAAWDIMGLSRHKASHTVVTVFVHCPHEEPIHTDFGDEAHAEMYRKLQEEDVSSRLKAWFAVNGSTAPNDQEAKTLTFNDMPKKYVYEKGKWRLRKRKSETTLGRIKSVSPRNLEQYAIRLLSSTLRGPTSFEDLRTVNGQIYPTFADACRQRGLMNSELEWEFALSEAATTKMPRELRRMFISILLFCAPKNPLNLWNKFKVDFYEHRSDWTDEKKEAHALHHISSGLRYHGTSLTCLGLPEVDDQFLPAPENLCDDSNTQVTLPDACSKIAQSKIKTMNPEQLNAFNTIVTSIDEDRRECFFLEGTGGCGKTFVYTAIYYSLVSKGHKVLSVAQTGIAAILLPNGATAHRTFCIPLTTEDGMNCRVELESSLATSLAEVTVVLWDEAPMTDHRILSAVHELFCRLHPEKDNLLFGGVSFVFGGDFRQTLPIVLGVRDSAILNYTIRRSELWNKLKILHLRQNMRAQNDPRFAKLLQSVGDGSINLDQTMREAYQEFDLPEEWLVPTERALIDYVFGGKKLEESVGEKSVILTVDNRTALLINEKILKMLPGEDVTFTSVDTYNADRGFAALDPETYATMTPSGLPPHKLKVKIGAIVILLRNMNVSQALCNGTRMKITNITPNVITCSPLIKSKFTPETVFLHRWKLSTTSAPTRELAFWRMQFPIRLAYSMTINKSQGQTFDRLGLLLRSPVFTHGQAYTALSRVRRFEDIKVYNSNKANRRRTSNIVYRDALV